MVKLKFKKVQNFCGIFESSNKSNGFIFFKFFFTFIKMSINLSAKYYQENKERVLEKGLPKISKLVVNDTKI